MNNDNTPVVLCEDDFKKLSGFLNVHSLHPADKMTLAHEINRAIVVRNEAFPINTIRINSWVRIEELESKKEREFFIVMPEDMNIRDKKISIFSPMGAALIGFRIGDEVSWKMPNGIKRFKILEVKNNKDSACFAPKKS